MSYLKYVVIPGKRQNMSQGYRYYQHQEWDSEHNQHYGNFRCPFFSLNGNSFEKDEWKSNWAGGKEPRLFLTNVNAIEKKFELIFFDLISPQEKISNQAAPKLFSQAKVFH